MTAFSVARKAAKYGVPFRTGLKIARAAKKVRLADSLAFALVEQESGFQHIFGHDNSFLAGQPVTKRRYQALQNHVRHGGASNGVGFTQLTYPGYILQWHGIWRKSTNLRKGFGLIRDAIRGGTRHGLAVYNGGPANPQYGYADSVLARQAKWAARFR